MFFFQNVPVQAFNHLTPFPGIYSSEDDYVNNIAQRAVHNHAQAHTRVQAFDRQRDYCRGRHQGSFAPASLENFRYGFDPARPALFTTNRRTTAHSSGELAYRVWQEEDHQYPRDRRLEAVARQRDPARERDAHPQRALAEAVARGQQARAARIQAREARNQEILLALLGQLGLAVAPARSAPVAPQVNRHQPSIQFTQPAAPAAPVLAPTSITVDRKGKGKAVCVPVRILAPIRNAVPVSAKVPTLKEELQARIRSEIDSSVQESLGLLYSELFDPREPMQPVAGPSGYKHVSFEVSISGPSSSASSSPIPVNAYGKVDTATALTPEAKQETNETKTKEFESPCFAVGIPDSDTDTKVPSPSGRFAHRDPSPHADDVEDLDGASDVFSPSIDASASRVIPWAVEAAAVPSCDFDADVAEQENISSQSSGAHSEAVAANVVAPVCEPSVPEPAEGSNNASPSRLPGVVAPGTIARVESAAKDATFVAAEVDSAIDDITSFHAGTTTLYVADLTQPPAPAPARDSASSEEHDELEIIGKDQLEAARNDSEWSDVGLECDLEVV